MQVRRGDTAPHEGPAKRPDRAKRVEAKSPGRLKRQETGKQAPVEKVEAEGAAHNIAASCSGIGAKKSVAADIGAAAARFSEQRGQGLDIPEAKIEPLSANRRGGVGGLSGKGDARASVLANHNRG